MVRTLVTFADFYRQQPLAFRTDLERFFLLIDGERIELNSTWPSASGQGQFAGLVVQVDCVLSDEGSQQPEWRLSVPSDSPRLLGTGDLEADFVLFFETLNNPGEHVANVQDGVVFHFFAEGEEYQRLHRMMLSIEEPPHEVKARDAQPTHLLSASHEVLVNIISFLPIRSILQTASFINSRMFNAAKAVEVPVVEMGETEIVQKDMEAICQLISPTCKALRNAVCGTFPGWEGYDNVTIASLPEHHWPALENLSFAYLDGDLPLQAFLGALKEGKFGKLQYLCMEPGIVYDLEPHHLNGWATPALTELAMNLNTLGPRGEDDFPEPCPQFPNLKKMHIHVHEDWLEKMNSPDFFITTAHGKGLLPSLEELRLEGRFQFRAIRTNNIPLTFLKSLKRLCLMIEWKWEDEIHSLDVASVLPVGSTLRSLKLSKGIHLTGWEIVSAPSLNNITELSISVSAPIPYPSMPNLEAARIVVLDTIPADQQVITDLLALPKMKILTLIGKNMLRRLANEISSPSGIKNLTVVGSEMDFKTLSELEDLRCVLEATPLLVRLHIESHQLQHPELVGHLLRSSVESLVSFVVHGSPDGQEQLVESMTKLTKTLSSDWQLGGPETKLKRFTYTAHTFRGGEKDLDKEDLLRFQQDHFLVEFPGLCNY